jgi:hypothetical protein
MKALDLDSSGLYKLLVINELELEEWESRRWLGVIIALKN